MDRSMSLMSRITSRVATAGSILLAAVLGALFLLVMQRSHKPTNFVGATLMDGQVTLVVALCPGESVTAVYINNSSSSDGEGPTLWRIDATEEGHRGRFAVGETPARFKESVPLRDPLPAGGLSAWAIIDGHFEMANSIDVSKLENGLLTLDEKPISSDEFDDREC